MFCACCVCSDEEHSKRQLFSNRAFGWKKGYFVTLNNRTSLREQLYCIHPQHTHSPCTSTCTTHPTIPSQLPSTTLLCTQLTNTKHSWQNGTRCRDGVNVLCRSHLVWLVFEGSIPTCACFHLENFFVTLREMWFVVDCTCTCMIYTQLFLISLVTVCAVCTHRYYLVIVCDVYCCYDKCCYSVCVVVYT